MIHTNDTKTFDLKDIFLAMLSILVLAAVCRAQDHQPNEFLNLSIEELNNLDVTSVTGVEEQWFRAPAAIYVITQEDIQRTGHQTLHELLRIVPGLSVSATSSSSTNSWTIGTRGGKGGFGNSILVRIDGRSIVDPSTPYVRWETEDLVLDDIKNIETIRGPGATLWGSNAVSGVINITSKSAEDTQGWLFNGITGTSDTGNTSLRYGGQLDDKTYFRVWAKNTIRSAYDLSDGSSAHDDWELFTSGFRIDSHAPDQLDWTLIGGIAFSDHIGGIANLPDATATSGLSFQVSDSRIQSAHIQATIHKQISDFNKWSMIASYEHNSFRNSFDTRVVRDVIDLDYRHRYSINDRQLFVWGAKWTLSANNAQNSDDIIYDPKSKTTHNVSAFIQSSTHFFNDQLTVILGSKFEHNDYTGFEIHPSIRATWALTKNNTVWGAISRAVRPPNRSTANGSFNIGYVGPPGFKVPFIIANDPDLKAEELIGYEMGYRSHLTKNLTLDIATYMTDNTNLVTVDFTNGTFSNHLGSENFGSEINLVWNPALTLKMEAGYSYARSFAHGFQESAAENSYPENQFHIRSYLDIGNHLELNAALYYVDETPTLSTPSYVRLDTGLTWKMNASTHISFWGQNLLDNGHVESSDPLPYSIASEIPRSFYMQVTLKF